MVLWDAGFTRGEPGGGDKAEVWKHIMCSRSGGKSENQVVPEGQEVNGKDKFWLTVEAGGCCFNPQFTP